MHTARRHGEAPEKFDSDMSIGSKAPEIYVKTVAYGCDKMPREVRRIPAPRGDLLSDVLAAYG